MLLRLVPFQFSRDLRIKSGRIELRDRGNTALACDKRLPEIIKPVPDRRKDTYPRNNDPPFFHNACPFKNFCPDR